MGWPSVQPHVEGTPLKLHLEFTWLVLKGLLPSEFAKSISGRVPSGAEFSPAPRVPIFLQRRCVCVAASIRILNQWNIQTQKLHLVLLNRHWCGPQKILTVDEMQHLGLANRAGVMVRQQPPRSSDMLKELIHWFQNDFLKCQRRR
jgi:hypothetical protein